MMPDEPIDKLDEGVLGVNALLRELAAEPLEPLRDNAPAPRWPVIADI